MKSTVLGREVEGDEDGVRYLDALDSAAEELFDEAKYHHHAKFSDSHGRKFILNREQAGHYLVAQTN